MFEELIRKSDVLNLLNNTEVGECSYNCVGAALIAIHDAVENMPPVKIVEMSNNQMLKDLIDRLTYYGTTYAIGDNLGREIDGTDELMLEAAECLGNCVELPCKTITEKESKRVVEEWINE